MKDHKYDIKKILNGQGSIIDDVNTYIQEETRRNDKQWCWFMIVVAATWLVFTYCNRITDADRIKIAKPIVDSMKIKYQEKLDKITDSLYSEVYKPKN